ncbi:MAG: translation initiation factor IF-2 N-terminal domain-containing protein, partial [bacterium]|nr:translation initiation factor IF-2 N-terminal domain-containing protein [Candidatus Colisoma equi]
MRIYEIAKEAGVTSADVLRAAEAAGIGASSAISTLTGDEAGKLREQLRGADASAAKAKREQKRSKAAELNAQFFAEQRAKLDEHLKIAKLAAEGAQVKVEGEGEQR